MNVLCVSDGYRDLALAVVEIRHEPPLDCIEVGLDALDPGLDLVALIRVEQHVPGRLREVDPAVFQVLQLVACLPVEKSEVVEPAEVPGGIPNDLVRIRTGAARRNLESQLRTVKAAPGKDQEPYLVPFEERRIEQPIL